MLYYQSLVIRILRSFHLHIAAIEKQTSHFFRVTLQSSNESTLQIQGAKMEDAGWYQCNASNAAGTSSLKGRVVVQARQAQQPAQPREQLTLRKVDRRDIRQVFGESWR